MKNIMQEYLSQHDLTINRVATLTGITQSTLQSASEKPIARSSVKLISAIGQAVGKDTGTVINELFVMEEESIKGTPIDILRNLLEQSNVMYLDAIDKLFNAIVDSKSISVTVPLAKEKVSLTEKINQETFFKATYDKSKSLLTITNNKK